MKRDRGRKIEMQRIPTHRTQILSFELQKARNNTYIKDTIHYDNEQVKS